MSAATIERPAQLPHLAHVAFAFADQPKPEAKPRDVRARKLSGLIEQQAGSEVIIAAQRPVIAELAREVFKTPTTVANAAQRLQLDISTKGIDKEDAQARAWIQRVRVTLQRALRDADKLQLDEGKGRKRKAPLSPLQMVLATLPELGQDEIDAVTNELLRLQGVPQE